MQKISNSAVIGENVQIGEFTVIKEDVKIGDDCIIGNNVVLHEGTEIGDEVRIDDNVVIGKQPMRGVHSIFSDDEKYDPPRIGDETLIGTGVVIYAGSKIGGSVLMADLATLREDSSIGDNTIVGRNVTIENYCQVGSDCKLQTNCYITAYSEIGDYVFVAPGVVTTNDNFAGRSEERFKYHKGIIVEDGGRIGANVTTLSGLTVENDALVAAGSTLTEDAPAKKIVMGSPARVHKEVPEAQLLENQKFYTEGDDTDGSSSA